MRNIKKKEIKILVLIEQSYIIGILR